MIFVDTSAFYALLDGDDAEHSRGLKLWKGEPPGEGGLVTTNYVVLESMALLQSRLGMPAVRVFRDAQAVGAFIAADRRGLSLVDLSSFETMRRLGIRSAFTFDRHFRQYGFGTVP
jgi:predicted nucleic acid-binding protein